MQHGEPGLPAYLIPSVLAVCLAAVAVWAAAVHRACARSGWPRARTVCFLTGIGLGAASLTASVAAGDMSTHMAAHVVLGMAAPILLAASAPVTLALRSLPVGRARSLSQLLRKRPVHVATHPFAVAALDAGGLWLIYRGGLHERAMANLALSAALGMHVLLTATILAAVLIQVDPVPRRPPAVRAAALLAVMASHNVLAKAMYADPPGWATRADGEHGALVMYYGGDAVHVVLVVVVCRAWARAIDTEPGSRRRAPHAVSGRTPRAPVQSAPSRHTAASPEQ